MVLAIIGGGFGAMFWAADRYHGDGVLTVMALMTVVWLLILGWFCTKQGRRAIHVLALAVMAQIGGCMVWGEQFLAYITRESSYRAACTNNLHQLGVALQAYYAKHGSFPPACVADAAGEPLYSWRVLVLPHMEQLALYGNYDLSESWDGPHNQAMSDIAVGVFHCPFLHKKKGPITDYVALTGPGTAFPGTEGATLEQLRHPPENTILLVEISDPGVRWAEPRDLDIRDVVRDDAALVPSSPHLPEGFHALFADGMVYYLDWERVRAQLGPDGSGKVVPEECRVAVPSLRHM